MQRDYERLDIKQFGVALLQSRDLDPVYVALYDMMVNEVITPEQLQRWLLAYMLCYHVGAACWLSEQEDGEFWRWVMVAAKNIENSPIGGRWPRSHERRHWRGGQAIAVVEALQARYKRPEEFVHYLVGDTQTRPVVNFPEFTAKVKEHRGFGDWAAFKLADLVDRLALVRVDFSYEDVTIYKDPIIAAEMLVRRELGLPEGVSVKPSAVRGVFDSLIEYFDNYPAPPIHDRMVGLQEVETILCKWKSHQNGRYPLFNDILEIHDGLTLWCDDCRTAREFAYHMPPAPLKEVA